MYITMQRPTWNLGGRHTTEGLWGEGDMEEEKRADVDVRRKGTPFWLRCTNSLIIFFVIFLIHSDSLYRLLLYITVINQDKA